MTADEIRDELLLIDAFCEKENINATFAIIGGAAGKLLLSYHGLDFRQTRDIDIVGLETTDEKKLLDYFKGKSIEQVDGVLIPDVPEFLTQNEYNEFDDGYTNIEVILPTLEMWICLKALTDRQKDLDDIMNTGVLESCDLARVIKLINEYKGDTLGSNPLRYHYEFVLQHLHKLSKA